MTSLLSIHTISAELKTSWLQYLPPVKNQGKCGNCWAEAVVTSIEGVVNKNTPQHVKDAWMKRPDNPFRGDQPISLSVKQLTECTDYKWLETI